MEDLQSSEESAFVQEDVLAIMKEVSRSPDRTAIALAAPRLP